MKKQFDLNKLIKLLFIFPIKVYQTLISPLLGPTCRFEPSCSHYMIGSIQEWGVIKGTWMGLKRIGRCHPWSPGGYDPVPKKQTNSNTSDSN